MINVEIVLSSERPDECDISFILIPVNRNQSGFTGEQIENRFLVPI
jgi:hypothetical protein